MKVGLSFANAGAAADPVYAVGLARAAEAAGVESLWTVEHVVVPAGYESQYPYSSSGRMAGGEDAPIPDPFVWLAFVAGATERIRLATGIIILPEHNPVIVAKTAATLDVLSGGRMLLGVGIGWLREEFEALGVPFEGRGRRTDEAVAAMRALWADDRPSYEGETVRFHDARMWPKPVRRAIPVVIGGHAESAARRAGRIGDGFFPGRAAPDELAALLSAMRRAAEEAGRDPAAIEVTAGGRATRETAERYRELGVSRIALPPRGADLAQVAESLAAAVEAVAGA